MSFIEDLGMQLGNTVMGGAMGMVMGDYNDQRQYKQQERLTGLQEDAQNRLADAAMARQMQMWKNTNYSAQMEELKKAGLNPALLYGMKGRGATMMGSGTGPQVSGGQAQQNPGEIMGMMNANMQLALLKAQKENIEADTAVKRGEAANKPLTGENIQADTNLKNVQTRWDTVRAEVAEATKWQAIGIIEQELNQITLSVQNQVQTNKITRDTATDVIKLAHQNAIGAAIENELKDVHIGKTKAEIDQIANAIEQKWTELELQGRGLDIQEFRSVIDANNPTLGQQLGNMLNSVKRKVDYIMGIGKEYVRPNQVNDNNPR